MNEVIRKKYGFRIIKAGDEYLEIRLICYSSVKFIKCIHLLVNNIYEDNFFHIKWKFHDSWWHSSHITIF